MIAARRTERRSRRSNGCAPARRFDLAILDMQMPGMDGLMLAREIRKLPGRRDHAAGSAHFHGRARGHPDFANAAFASCLTKPIKPAQLHESLVRVVSGASPRPRESASAAQARPHPGQRACRCACCCATTTSSTRKSPCACCSRWATAPTSPANGVEALAAARPAALRPDFHGRDDARDGRAGSHAPDSRAAKQTSRSFRITNRPSSSSP